MGGLPLSFIMIDLDHFKNFNDTYGHSVGDEVLKATAQVVATVVRGKGEAYRYGGEEISVILPNHALVEAAAVAERIRNEIERVRIIHHRVGEPPPFDDPLDVVIT